MFGRGNWAVFGIESASIEEFQKALADPFTAFKVSQLAASITSKFQNQEAVGINPFGAPRLDEKLTDIAVLTELGTTLSQLESGDTVDRELIEDNLEFVATETTLSLGNNKYGFWVVYNYPEDPTDPNSKREQLAYEQLERPYKFLVKEEKKAIDDQVAAEAVLNRSQYPVFLDFQNGRVYTLSSNKDEVIAVQELLTTLGVKTLPLVWDFKYPSWPGDFLNKVVKETHFKAQMKERADELSRFRPDEVAKLDDRAMEKIVSTYFSLTPLDSELWCGLTTPARIRLHKAFDPVGVPNPSVAFTLLDLSNDSEIAAASVVFQELKSKITKAGDEKIYRNDLFTIDINDNANLQDAGAAMLRGFDLPQFKRDVKTTIKAKGRVEIRDFWALWLQGLNDSVLEFVDNVTDVLSIDKKKYGLRVFEPSTDSELVEVSE